MTERKNKDETVLTLEALSNTAKSCATTGGIEGVCAAYRAVASTLDLIGYYASHQYPCLEKEVNFPSNLRNEITKEEEGKTVKYVLEATGFRLDADTYYYDIPEKFRHHPVLHGDYTLTKYKVEPVNEKVKKPVKTTIMKKRFFGLGKPKPIEITQIVEEEVDTGKRKDVELWNVIAGGVFMRVPEFKPVSYPTDEYSYHQDDNPYFGSSIAKILGEIRSMIRYGSWKSDDLKTEEVKYKRESRDKYFCTHVDLKEEESDKLGEILKELIFPIGEKIADKFRQAKALCPDSEG